jgi:hypothetical protein
MFVTKTSHFTEHADAAINRRLDTSLWQVPPKATANRETFDRISWNGWTAKRPQAATAGVFRYASK